APAQAALPAPVPRRGPPPRIRAPKGARQAGFALALGGGLAFAFAVYQTAHFLDSSSWPAATPPLTRDMLPEGPQAVSHPEEKGTRAYEAAREIEPTDLPGAVERLRAVAKDFPSTSAAKRANARIAEVYPMLAAREWRVVEDGLGPLMNSGKFRRALDLLTDYERRFAGTD